MFAVAAVARRILGGAKAGDPVAGKPDGAISGEVSLQESFLC
jgi:hypothetical protein